MTPEQTGTDADDHAEQQATMTVGALRDELGARHVAYRRALERLQEVLEAERIMLAATLYDPEQHKPSRQLGVHWRAVREAQELWLAARLALQRHRAAT